MTTRISSLLLKPACVAAVVFGMTAPSTACCWFPFWPGYSAYYAPAYPGYYGPGYCNSGCSSCGSGGCGIGTYYAPAACGCSPCGCAPCSGGCGVGCNSCSSGCGVGYRPDANPVPDNGAEAGGDRRTFREEESTGNTTEEPPPAVDDFDKDNGAAAGSTNASDPFPEFERPVRGTSDDEDADPAPLEELDNRGVTLHVTPTRHRVRAEARYRVPRIVRLEVAPGSPWLPAGETAARIASN